MHYNTIIHGGKEKIMLRDTREFEEVLKIFSTMILVVIGHLSKTHQTVYTKIGEFYCG